MLIFLAGVGAGLLIGAGVMFVFLANVYSRLPW